MVKVLKTDLPSGLNCAVHKQQVIYERREEEENTDLFGEILMFLPGLIGFLIFLAIILLVVWLVITIVFYAAGRVVSGINTTFTDAMIVSLLGAICNTVLTAIFEYVFAMPSVVAALAATPLGPYLGYLGIIISALITICIYIPLIMKFFDTGFWGAVAVGLLVIIFQIIVVATIFFFVIPILLVMFP